MQVTREKVLLQSSNAKSTNTKQFISITLKLKFHLEKVKEKSNVLNEISNLK